MKPLSSCLVLALSFGLPAWGATALEAARAAAHDARQKVNDVRSRQMVLRGELNQVATRIETLKAQRPGKLLPGAELESALRRSQELSAELTQLAQALAASESASEKEHLSLLSALSDELGRARGEFDRATDPAARKELIARMRALRAEREQVRAALPASSVPVLGPASAASDDPEDLLEQADALRDREDKVRRELAALEALITEHREERELDRRMGEFLGDENIFDEHDRRFRMSKESVERVQTTSASPAQSGGFNFGAAPQADSAEAAAGGAPEPAGSLNDPAPSVGTARDVNQGEKALQPPPETTESVVTRSARASDAHPNVGGGRASALAGGKPDDLDALELQRQKLKGLAEELRSKAKKLEEQAKALR
ncbi:MAG: TetR family transcriptional regulator [Myxococcota bacterium]